MLYRVYSPMFEQELIVEAKNATQAKRKACRLWGISPSDPWHGISTLTARRLTEEETSEELRKWGVGSMRIFRCDYCGYKAPEYLFEYGRGREFGEHPEHRYCPRCGQSIDWVGYGIFWEEIKEENIDGKAFSQV